MSTNESGNTTKRTAKTAVALNVPSAGEMLSGVRTRLKALKIIADAPLRTHGLFKYTPSATASIEIQKVTDLATLINILGFLLEKESNYDLGAEMLNLKEYPLFKWCSYTTAEWKHDIEVRVAIINHQANMDELQAVEKELVTMLSQTDKLALMTAKLTNMGIFSTVTE